MLDAFNTTASPTSISTHLSTFDSTKELRRITDCFLQRKYETDEYDSLHQAETTLMIQETADSKIEQNAQVLGLMTVSTLADGNCL